MRNETPPTASCAKEFAPGIRLFRRGRRARLRRHAAHASLWHHARSVRRHRGCVPRTCAAQSRRADEEAADAWRNITRRRQIVAPFGLYRLQPAQRRRRRGDRHQPRARPRPAPAAGARSRASAASTTCAAGSTTTTWWSPRRRRAARPPIEMAGVGPADVDTAQIYDCFTYMVLTQLEDYGFCKKGEGGPFVASGALRMGGRLPTNTSGGQLRRRTARACCRSSKACARCATPIRPSARSRMPRSRSFPATAAIRSATRL